jgi:Zn finger protein HypA/HybF involved in hydrogenase expression
MTNHQPIEIAGENFAPVVVPCPECDAAIDAQRALHEGACPECRTPARALMDGAESPPDEEHEAHKLSA